MVGDPGTGVGHALAIDASGDVVVVGDLVQPGERSQRDLWAAKYLGSDGSEVWQVERDGGLGLDDFARAVVIAEDGTIVVAGAVQEVDVNHSDVWLGWLEPEMGDEVLVSNLGTTDWDEGMGELDEAALALEIHPVTAELLVGGSRCKRPCVTPDAWIGRYTSLGVTIWDEPMVRFGSGAVRGVVGFGDGMVLAGTDGFVGGPTAWRSKVRQVNPSGGGAWSPLQEPGFDGDGYEARAIGVGADGAVWVVGRVFSGDEDIGGFVRLYDPPAVTPLAEVSGQGVGGTALALVVNADGATIAGGTGTRLWFAQFDQTLAQVWRVEEDAATSARALAIDGVGDIVVLGVITAADGERLWLRKYVTAG